jgi:nucleotide-binding universal stress UspA family protein
MFRKILVTVDGSKASEAVLPHVGAAAGPDTEVTFFTVAMVPEPTVQPVYVGPPTGVVAGGKAVETKAQAIERVREEQTVYLDSLAAPLRAEGLTIETRVAFGWDPGEEIVNAAKDLDVDVILMATHGRTALGQIVFGSVAEKVMQSGVCPVLMVRPSKLN